VLATGALALALLIATAATATVSIYSNDMLNSGRRGQIRKLSGQNCDRGGAPGVLKVRAGKKTEECAYRTPVVGRDLEIETTARLLSGTPKKLQRRAFVALELRAGGGGRYTFAVFPRQDKYQIRKDVPGQATKFLAVGKQISRIGGINEANKMRLQVFNILSTKKKGDGRILAFVNNKRMAVIVDDRIGALKGRFSGFSVGAGGTANGAVASFDDVSVRIPSPF
jgi:hypothetical protein